jgi:AbrB family looped-hinge helix DNA binding protein
MVVELVKMSSKGQVVIPKDLRDRARLAEGTFLAATATRDTIILKRVKKPSKDELIRELNRLGRESRERLEKLGFTEQKIIETALAARHRK